LKDVKSRGVVRDAEPLHDLRRYLGSLFAEYGGYYDEFVLADTRGYPIFRFDRSVGATVYRESSVPYPIEPAPPVPPTGSPDGAVPAPRGGAFSAVLPAFREADRLTFQAGVMLAPGEHSIHLDDIVAGRPPVVGILRSVVSNDRPNVKLGYILTRIRSDYLWPEELAGRRFGHEGQLGIVEIGSGEILYHTQSGWIGRRVSQVDPELNPLAVSRHAPSAGAPQGGTAASWVQVPGKADPRVMTILGTRSAPWNVVVTATPGEFSSEARKAGLFNLVVASLALMAAAIVLVLASGRLSRSIHSVTESALRIAGGDLSGPPIRAETHDEIETLADAFNTMTASVRRNIAMREQTAAELDALNRSLETRVHERTQELETLNAALNRANEELKQLDMLKSNFLATVSHEFKTPLSSIKAFAEILHDELEERNTPGELKRFLRIIDSESDRLARLINNVLDLSRIESGQMLWRLSEFPVASVIDAAVDGLLPALKGKQIRLEREIICDGAMLHADQDRIQEVLTNVLDNAIKASALGQRITIGCREADEIQNGRGRLIRVFVRDEGQGIPPDQIDKIFDRFHQVGTHGLRRKGGTGLGLAISREITEHHGGRIWAESAAGRGSTFHITLPVATESDLPRATGDAPVRLEKGTPGAHPYA